MTAGVGGRVLLVADAGPLIVLGLAGLLAPTARVYGSLAVPEAVLGECLTPHGLPGEAAIRAALVAGQLLSVHADAPKAGDPSWLYGLGAGELAVLAHAQAHGLTALVDDRKARRTAQRLGVAVLGSGALLVGLKQQACIVSVRAVLAQWAAHGYFVGESVRAQLLAAAGEG